MRGSPLSEIAEGELLVSTDSYAGMLQSWSWPPSDPGGCDRAGARDYAAFLGFFFLEPF
jgi:hypothetical protein